MDRPRQKFKVKALIQREYEIEAPTSPKERNEFVQQQLSELISTNGRLAEYVILDECDKVIALVNLPLPRAEGKCTSIEVGTPATSLPLNQTSIQDDASKPKPFKLKQLGIPKYDQFQAEAIAQAADRAAKGKEYANVGNVLLSLSDIQVLDNAEKKLAEINITWKRRALLKNRCSEDYKLLERKRSELMTFIVDIRDYGLKIAQKRSKQRGQKAESKLQALRDRRDADHVSQIAKELGNLSVDTHDSDIANETQSIDDNSLGSERQSRLKRPSRRILPTPCNPNEIWDLKKAIEDEQQQHDPIMDNRTARLIAVVEKMNKKQRDRSRSPGRTIDVKKDDRDIRMRESLRLAEWTELVMEARRSAKKGSQEDNDDITLQ